MWRCSKCQQWGTPATHECTEVAMPLDLEKLRYLRSSVIAETDWAELIDLAARAQHYETALWEIADSHAALGELPDEPTEECCKFASIAREALKR